MIIIMSYVLPVFPQTSVLLSISSALNRCVTSEESKCCSSNKFTKMSGQKEANGIGVYQLQATVYIIPT
jgi:hypothetical protein